VTDPTIDHVRIQELLDRVAIEDCLVRYCHAVDRCDAALLRTVYWPDAIDDHVFWRGKADAIVDFCMPILESRDQTLHSVCNFLIRIEGNEARVECHFHAYERLHRKDGTANDVTMWGRYLDRMEKRAGEWRIADRKVVLDSWRIWEDSADWARGLFGKSVQVGGRGDADLSAALFGDRLHRR
jgi:SnoaL-like domain